MRRAAAGTLASLLLATALPHPVGAAPPRAGVIPILPPNAAGAAHTPVATASPAARVRATPAPAPSVELTESRRRIGLALLKVRLYRVLWKYDPASFAKLIEALEYSPRAQESPENLMRIARSRVMPLVRRHVAHARGQTLDEYTGNLLIELRKAAAEGGDACFALLGANDEAALKLASVDLGTLDDFGLDRLADAVKTSLTEPVPAPKRSEIAANLRRAASSVELRFGPDATILERIDEPGVDRKRVCEIAVSLYGGVLGRIRDHGEAQALLRYLMDPPPDDAPAASTTGATPSPAP